MTVAPAPSIAPDRLPALRVQHRCSTGFTEWPPTGRPYALSSAVLNALTIAREQPPAPKPEQPPAATERAGPLLSANEERVFAALVAGVRAGASWSGTPALADSLMLQNKTIDKALRALESAGRIVVERNHSGKRISIAIPNVGSMHS